MPYKMYDTNFPLPLFVLVESEFRDGRKSESGINSLGSTTLLGFFLNSSLLQDQT
jgi:hypothetical protein